MSPSRPSSPPARRRGADAGTAFGMLLLDAVGVGLTLLFVIGSGLGEALGASDSGGPTAGEVAALGFGLLTAFAVLSSVLLLRARARIAGTTQGLVACVALLVALGAFASERSATGPDAPPRDDAEVSDSYTGPGGQCRSGGGNAECEGTAG